MTAQTPDFIGLKIPHFSGKISEAPEKHLRIIEVEKWAWEWDESAAKRVLGYFLSGSARDWHDNKKDELEEKSWNDVKDAFMQRFHPNFRYDTFQAIMKRKQQRSETPVDFYDAMCVMRKPIMEGYGLSDKYFIKLIIAGLLPEPRSIIAYTRNKSLQELEENIQSAEEALDLREVRDHDTDEYKRGHSAANNALEWRT